MSATAVIEAICERPPDSTTMAVLGGLASTGNEPVKPATMLPAPTPAKSRLASSGRPSSEGKVLATADVCMMQTMATMRASGRSRATSRASGNDGSARRGSSTWSGSSRLTPRVLRWNSATATPAATTPISAPRADPGRAQGHDQHAGAERERIGIGLPQAAEDVKEAQQKVPPLLGYAEQRRQLAHHDVDRDAREKARRHGGRKQGREPAGPQ